MRAFSSAQNIFIDNFPNEVPLYNPYRQLVLQEFKMNLGLVISAKHFIGQVAINTGAEIFVGMHVRRTDYGALLKARTKGRLLSKRVGLKLHIISQQSTARPRFSAI